MPSTAELWILLILIPEWEVFAHCPECPDGSYWDEPKQLPGMGWLPQAEGQKRPLSSCRMFSQSSPSHLIEHLQNISSELNFFNPGGHLKTVASADMNLAPNFVFLSALCFLTGNN